MFFVKYDADIIINEPLVEGCGAIEPIKLICGTQLLEMLYFVICFKYKFKDNKIVPIHPKVSMDDPLVKKAERAIKSFIATNRDKTKEFELIFSNCNCSDL